VNEPNERAYGAQHPLCQSDGTKAWECAPGVFAWQIDKNVVIQGEDGDVTIPEDRLALLGRALLAAHVQNGRKP
jgi:hypothetical protein